MYNLKDKTIEEIINLEQKRQQDWIEMIASENYVSKDVMMACANFFTNKYSEGYVGKRYYWWQEYVDKLESITQERALKIFWLDWDSWHVNVQPLSGWPANLAVYIGVLNVGDTILWMDLSSWGHLTHGHKLNASGIYYNIVSYWVKKEDNLIDYDEILQKALEYKPKLILAWFSAYPRQIDWQKFKQIVDQIEDKYWYRPILMADIAHVAGLIAGEAYHWPFPWFDIVTTTTHKTLRWPRWWLIYCKKDYQKQIDKWVFPWVQWWPHQHIIASKAVAFGEILYWLNFDENFEELQKTSFKEYAKKVVDNAKVLATSLQDLWWNITTWWTDNHIVLLDITKKNWNNTNIWWKQAEIILENVWISTNKNVLPFDDRQPLDPSGLRLWTAAVTTRGFWESEIKKIAFIIDNALINSDNEKTLSDMQKQINDLCQKFPI